MSYFVLFFGWFYGGVDGDGLGRERKGRGDGVEENPAYVKECGCGGREREEGEEAKMKRKQS
jgi:hypothetical protein